ncbi:ABC multidrug transporter B [Cladobotryum mycophilum]|uniref:ABC multidrug transporter B n=1 Tax=Cladobotryum mycophilum TaxID=491253 RepID=A0ABR0SCV0_9HYPO
MLSWFEHAYSPRPSALINVYLLLSVLFDAVQTRTLWLKHASTTIPALFTASLAIKIGLLALESVEKSRYLPPAWSEKSPEEKSGVFSQSLLLWLRRILVEGRKRLIYPNDLYALEPGLETRRLSDIFWKNWHARNGKASQSTLVLVLVRTLKWSLLTPVVPRLAQVAFTICQPLMLQEFLRYLQGEGNFVSGTGGGFIGAYGLVYCGLAISTCYYWRLTYKCLVKMRGCLVAAIYKKTTEIDTSQYDMTAPIALMSTDIERILQGCKDLHEIWANTAQVGISIWLLYENLGVACVAPAVVAVLSSIGSVLMSSWAESSQTHWMEATQERVGATVKVIASMKVVRLLGLSDRVHKVLKELRLAELHAARFFRYIEVLTAVVSFTPLLLSPVFTFMVFVIQAQSSGEKLDTTKIFTSLSLLQLMTQPLVWLFQAVPMFFASLGCLNRIGQYLHAQSRTEKRHLHVGIASPRPASTSASSTGNSQQELKGIDENAVTVRDGTFGWKEERSVLQDVDVDIPTSKLTMVIGPVASGKSSFCKAVIGELPYVKGQIHVNISRSGIAYCDQNTFLLNGTLQDNIVGFSDLDSNWFETVVRAVDLTKDISTLSDGVQTKIGSKGVVLSGGQRQRVAIARALYARPPLAVFDDVLSGLDPVTKKNVFEHVFSPRGLLRKMGCTAVLSTHDVDLLPEADHIIAFGKDGHLAGSGNFDQLSKSSEYIKSLGVRDNSDSSSGGIGGNPDSLAELSLGDEPTNTEALEDISRRLGDASIYKYLYSHIGLWRMLLFALFQCGWAVFSTIGPVWLKFWAAANASGKDNDGYYMGVYAAFQGLALVFLALFAGHTLTSIAVKSGASLHEVLLKTVIMAPISFFSTVDVGITTNRFSQDVILIDGDLPMAMLETVSSGLVAIVQAILIAIAAPYVAIAYPFLLAVLYMVQGFYLRTSRQLRHLDLEAKSPLYTHFLETLQGLATIRSFGWSEKNNELNHRLVDASQQPLYLLYMVQRWLQLVLELLIAATSIILIAVAVNLHSTSASLIGVALVNLMSISQELKMIVLNWTNLETSLSAIARTKSFAEGTSSENKPEETIEPPPTWPQSGRIQLQSVSACYKASDNAVLVLKDVSVDIHGGKKIAICGRSGSGKSSFILALCRMIELTSGSIIVDGLDLSTAPRSMVRSAFNVIPQEPFFFYKKLSENLDPSGSISASAMESVLKEVQLWDTVESAGGLDADFDIETLSQGQKQLLALARAILRPGKIVIMDEATSNVDKHAAEIMQRIIRDKFNDRTVVAVAHQLSTIIDFDHVIVMDGGQLVESDSPAGLLARDSVFRQLCAIQGVGLA